jgi:molybdate transport system regulatory protein
VAILGRSLAARQKVWVEKRGRMVMGEGRARLLRAVEQEGSINRGAKRCGLSFRRAWAMIHTMEERAGRKILSTVIGGPTGGGSTITAYGKELLRQYEKLSHASSILLEQKMKER